MKTLKVRSVHLLQNEPPYLCSVKPEEKKIGSSFEMNRTQNPQLSKYLALGSVSDFDLLPESRHLIFFFLTQLAQVQHSYSLGTSFSHFLDTNTSFSSVTRTPQPKSRGHFCPLVASHQMIKVPSGDRTSLAFFSLSSFESSGNGMQHSAHCLRALA